MSADRKTSGQVNSLQELRAHVPTGNAGPVLREIATALARLLDTGAPTIIDLGALPFSAGDERALDAALGEGEIRATITVLGTSQVVETGTPGVWRVDHYDQNGETLSRFVEITFVPEILKTQIPDARDGLARLEAHLAARSKSK
ncbi:MAG: hypothetical protein CSA74_11500 [Rhodobacterales bacterium]|nr:MAG: hypothetical protein CSA74_11500 [Rhodobacterales bacterium]